MSTPLETVAQLRHVWASIAELGAATTAEQWVCPTGCPGWETRDVIAHVVGTEASMAGEKPPPAPEHYPAHVLNQIGEFNERWVAHLRALDREELLARLREVTTARLSALEAMSEDDWGAPSWTPAGPGTYLDFMRIRLFDCWAHEQDLRWVMGRPGGTEGPWVDTALAVPRATLPKIVARGVRAPEGTVVEWVLEGEPERRWRVTVRDGRGVPLDGEDGGAPAVRLRSGVPDFVMRACGRIDPASGRRLGQITVEGDEELGQRLVAAMALPI